MKVLLISGSDGDEAEEDEQDDDADGYDKEGSQSSKEQCLVEWKALQGIIKLVPACLHTPWISFEGDEHDNVETSLSFSVRQPRHGGEPKIITTTFTVHATVCRLPFI